MKRLALFIVAWALVAFQAGAGESQAGGAAQNERVRFDFVDIYIDSGAAPLAAYQVEINAETDNVKIVGIEGGQHLAFKDAPYYDPAALSQKRVIIAAFSTGATLPTGRTRVARIHVRLTGERKPEYVVTLEVAATAAGKPIAATATAAQGEGK